MSKIIASVIINTYNYGHFIEESIESVLNQTFAQKYIEIVVIDDGSTDDTSERVKKYRDKIKYIYKNNGGQASAFNYGLKHANGEYIFLLDSDDYCFPNRVERVVEEFESNSEIVCVLNSRRILYENYYKDEVRPSFTNVHLNKESAKLIQKASYGTSRTALRRSVIDNILPLPEKGLMIEADLYLNLIILWYGNISCLNEVLTYYRIHGDNLFCISNYEKLPLQISSMQLALNYIREKAISSQRYNRELLDSLLKPYEIELLEKFMALNVYNGKATRKQIVSLELKKLGLGWKNWGTKYKFYKLSSLPLYFLFSPEFIYKLKNYYSKNKLFKIREKLFN